MKKIVIVILALISIKNELTAQNATLIITDAETEISYKTSSVKPRDRGGIEFMLNPTQIINGPETHTDNFKVISGPSEKVSVTVYNPSTGMTTTTSWKICDNTNIWPCALVRGSIGTTPKGQ